MDGLTLTANHKKTCYLDDMDCHQYGANTLLLEAHTVPDHDESVWDIIMDLLACCNGYTAADLPFVATELESAITKCINDLDRSYYVTNPEFPDCKVFVLLDWTNEDDQ